MKNSYVIDGDSTRIELVRRDGMKYFTIVDTSQLDKLIEFDIRWNAVHWPRTEDLYVQGTVPIDSGIFQTVILHRWLINAPRGSVVDHKNHDTLDNRLSNLRVTSHSKNGQNRRSAQIDNKVGTRGVSWDKRLHKWKGQATLNGKKIGLGVYSDIKEAERVVTLFRQKFMPLENSPFSHKEIEQELIRFKYEFIPGYKPGRSGVRYVNWHKKTSKWIAVIPTSTGKKHIGLFDSIEDAAKAVESALRVKR